MVYKRICNTCKKEKEASDFSKNPMYKDGLNHKCKECHNKNSHELYVKQKDKSKQYHKLKYIKEKERIKNKNKQWVELNKEKHQEYLKKYSQINKNRINTYKRNRRNENLEIKIKSCLRGRLCRVLKDKKIKKEYHMLELLGCSFIDLKHHLENQFKDGMTWGNYGRGGWHIDHIKPCASFNLKNTEEQKKCFHYSNLQPLWEIENLIKGSKII
jgi:ferredoxin-like protein FixX